MKKNIQALMEAESMQKALAFLKEDDANTLKQQLELVQISAWSNHEQERAQRFQQLLEEAGYETCIDEVCNVYTRIRGTGEGPTVYISAHLDTVFPPETSLEVKHDGPVIRVPGICDDTRGLAEILTMARAIRAAGLKPVGDIIIGGNVGEEGLGDLRGMRHFFGKRAAEIDGFLSVDGVGELICYGGTGSRRYEVTFTGPGGHSYGAFGLVNPVHAMGRAIAYISELRTPAEPKTTFSVGVVSGGTSVNAIAYECSMQVDLRADGKDELEKLNEEFHECIRKAVEDENNRWTVERTYKQEGLHKFDTDARIHVEIKPIGNRPVGNQSRECEIVEVLEAAYEQFGVTPDYMSNGSTDANVPISLGIPGACICGGGKGGNYHSVEEWFDPTDAWKGPQRNLTALFALVGLDGVCAPGLSRRKR